jgi:hypothetical protein
VTDPLHNLDELLRAVPGDAGCAAGQQILDVYAELVLSGEYPERVFLGVAIHVRSCTACAQDLRGLLDAARTFGDATPDESPPPRRGE